MSKTAHKTANRSALKKSWNPPPLPRLKIVPPKTSWWLVGAAPNDRDQFVAAQRQRALEVWTNVTPHAMNPRGEFS